MHVVAVTDVQHFLKGSDSAALCLDEAAYQRMASLVADSFARSASGEPVDAGPGIYGNSQFYIANGSYNALNTCNRWTASVLEAAGITISPRISLTAGSVLGAAQQCHALRSRALSQRLYRQAQRLPWPAHSNTGDLDDRQNRPMPLWQGAIQAECRAANGARVLVQRLPASGLQRHGQCPGARRCPERQRRSRRVSQACRQRQ